MSAKGQELFPETAAASSSRIEPRINGAVSREEILRQQLLARRRIRADVPGAQQPGSSTPHSADLSEITLPDERSSSEDRRREGIRKEYDRDESRTPSTRLDEGNGPHKASSSLAGRLADSTRWSQSPQRRNHSRETNGRDVRPERSTSPKRAEPRFSSHSSQSGLPPSLGLPPRPDMNTAAWWHREGDSAGTDRTDDRHRPANHSMLPGNGGHQHWQDRPPHVDIYSRDGRASDPSHRPGDYGYGDRRDLNINQGRAHRMDRQHSSELINGRKHDGYGREERGPPGDERYPVSNGQPGRDGRDNGYGRPVMPTPLPPQRVGFDRPPRYGGNRGGYGRGPRGAYDFEQRRLQREASTISVWPPSPKEPYRSESESDSDYPRRSSRKTSSRRHRRSRYSSASDTGSDSEVDDRRRRHSRRDKERRSSKRYTSSEDPEEDARRGRRTRSRRSAGSETDDHGDDSARRKRAERSRRKEKRKDEKAKRDKGRAKDKDKVKEKVKEKEQPMTLEELAAMQKARAEEEEVVGPLPPSELAKLRGRIDFKDMLPGEAEAMAHFLATGQRIPRRGEIGYDADAIKMLEDSGYVMSGSRHKRMNAVRLRKENQVISAEEKRAILNLQRDERGRKEGMIISQFKELMDTAIKRNEAK